MKKLFWVSVVIAILAAFFASANPDGLDFISEKLGFSGKGQERTAPMADYSVGFLPEGGISTSTAGIAGILITLGLFWLAAYIIKKGDNKMNGKTACLIALTLIAASPVLAARPLVTDDFGTVDPGKYELEVGYNSTTPKAAGSATSTGLGVSFKRGFTDSFDLGIEAPYSLTAPTGLGDAILHAKYKALTVGEDEGLTARLDLKLTNGDSASGLGSGYTDYTAMLIYSKPFGGIKTHYNLGYTLVGVASGAPEANVTNYSAALEKEVATGIEVVGEYYGTSMTGGSTSNVQIGGRWQALEAVRFDAGYSLALNDSSDNVATAGLTAEF